MANLSSYLPGGIDPAAVTITGGSINGTTIGASTPSTGAFTTFTSNGIDDNATSTAITIDSSQNVGIGVTNPTRVLQTDGSQVDFSRSGKKLEINPNAGNADTHSTIQVDSGMALAFSQGGLGETLRIDSSGNVGIGTTSNIRLTGGKYLTLDNASETGIELGIGGVAHGELFASGNDVYLANRSANSIIFRTNGSNERMRIDSSGGLRIGTTTHIFNTAASEKLSIKNTATGCAAHFEATDVTGGFPILILRSTDTAAGQNAILFYRTNTTVGSITTSGTSTSYNTSSDERLKENIVDAPAGNIDAIRVRSFDWKVDGSHQTYGMVAQELVDVAPEAVTQGQTEDDMWGVDYSKLVPMMIKEIQDLKAEVAALKGA